MKHYYVNREYFNCMAFKILEPLRCKFTRWTLTVTHFESTTIPSDHDPKWLLMLCTISHQFFKTKDFVTWTQCVASAAMPMIQHRYKGHEISSPSPRLFLSHNGAQDQDSL